MAQHDLNIANQGFPAFRSDLNNALSAIQTTHSGTSRPTGAVAGQIWLDTTSATTPTLKYYDGADDISLATLDHSANTVNWLDSTVSITGLSTTATGTVLTLSDSASTSTVNLILDNQKEIRFRETTANGTNYVALKAPASLSADLTFTLPATDGTSGQVLQTNGSGVLSFATVGGLAWQSVQTSGFTAVASRGYPCNTTSSAFTVTLPASPSVGDTIQIVDYAGTFATNNITISPNGNNINGSTSNRLLNTSREGVSITYVDSTQGWVASSGVNEGTASLTIAPYSVDFLVIAGGGGGGYDQNNDIGAGGGGAGGYRNSFSTETSGGGGSSESSLTFSSGIVYTITVGAGGAGNTGSGTYLGVNGSDSLISGSDISTVTSIGGGGGAGASGGSNGASGGSGGGSRNNAAGGVGGAGTANQGFAGGNGANNPSGGGGGAGELGNADGSGAGGDGLASSITGSSITRAGGGGGGSKTGSGGVAGDGGGGAGGLNGVGTNGATNAGAGGGGGGGSFTGGTGGSGVVILSMPDASYSGTTTGSPTVATGVSGKTVLTFTASGTYTG